VGPVSRTLNRDRDAAIEDAVGKEMDMAQGSAMCLSG
jgi:hypothetical protein